MRTPFLLLAGILAAGAYLGALAVSAQPGHCPPGLAAKNPPCVPPGLAKKGVGTADRLPGDLDRLRDPGRYRLPPLGENEGYYRDGRIVYRVDVRTRRVLDWIELTADILSD